MIILNLFPTFLNEVVDMRNYRVTGVQYATYWQVKLLPCIEMLCF